MTHTLISPGVGHGPGQCPRDGIEPDPHRANRSYRMDTIFEPLRVFVAIALCPLGVVAGAEQGQAAGPRRPPEGAADVNVQIVDALTQRYGVHAGFRSNHAKGILVEGEFTPTLEAAK